MIRFNKTNRLYGCFSNFYPCIVNYDGITYKSSEAAWQSLKTTDTNERKKFSSYTPVEAKHAGKRVELRPDWERVKYELMKDVLYAKFTQNEDLKEILLSTDGKILIEDNTWHDNIWGACSCKACKNKSHRNLLGLALMEVRASL